MPQPITIEDKYELIRCIEKLKDYENLPELQKAVKVLKNKNTLFGANDHKKIITFVIAITTQYPKVETDPNNEDLINLCKRIIKNSPEEKPQTPRAKL